MFTVTIFFFFAPVSTEIIQPTAITAQKGHPVYLTIQKHANEMQQFDDLEWLKDGLHIVVSYNFRTVKIHSSYKERVDFNTENYSLTLKNIQETDSGLYTARASGESDIIIGKYSVTVVSSDTIQPTAITVQRGHLVHLTIQKPANEIPQFDDLEWLKDGLHIVVSYNFRTVKIHSSYKERVDFNTENYSLTLKNIQETDSGLYTARASGESDIIIGKYNVTVDSTSHGTTGSVSLTWFMFLVLLRTLI
uniref:Ig-like domain-containing protein n=1 Tax=Cyprinus carpio TaxID=7962 RepID=A0A8C1MQ62_CYPCA